MKQKTDEQTISPDFDNDNFAAMEAAALDSTSTDENGVHDIPVGRALVPIDTSFQIAIPEGATIEDRLMLMDFMGDSESLWNQLGNVLSFVGMIASDSFKRDETGALLLDDEDQPIPCKLSIWRTEEGRLFRAQSMVAYGYLRDRVWPVMTIENKQGYLLAPLTLRIGQKLTRNGKHTFKFDKVG